MNIVGCIPRFLKAHGGWVLTGLSVLGLTGTAVLTAKAAPKANQALQEAKDDKIVEWIDGLPDEEYRRITSEAGMMDDFPKEAELTFIEKFDAVAPHYIPAFLCYIVTAGCMIGAQIFNMKQQAAILAAYGLLARQFQEYRQEVRLAVGDEKERLIFEASQRKIQELEAENAKLKAENAPGIYAFSMTPEIMFEAKPEHIFNALMHYNRNMILQGYDTMAELYKFTGIPADLWEGKSEFEDYGWEIRENEITYDYHYVDFSIKPIDIGNGKVVNMICPDITPYKLWSQDYLSVDEPFRGHYIDDRLVEQFIKTSFTGSDIENFVMKVDHPDIAYFNF